MLTEITPCPCCGKFRSEGCVNIDHNPYQTREYNELAAQYRDHGGWEEFHQKRGNGTMFEFHKTRRLEIQKRLDAIRIAA